jgi:hypothetical protein
MFKRKRLFLIPIVLLLLAIPGFIAWAVIVPPAMTEALDKMESSATVNVSRDRWIVFQPADSTPDTGFIFYPGGRVVAKAYAPLAYDLAEQGYLIVIVPMPLNLAVFGVNSATDVIEAYPDIQQWALGGHSLGGAMAANYIAANPGKVDGLVLMASYPQASDTLAAQETLVVASIYGTLDGLATPDKIAGSKAYLPDDTLFVEIDGGNHAQFGWYGDQAGDNPATITHQAQQEQVFAAVLAVLEKIDN